MHSVDLLVPPSLEPREDIGLPRSPRVAAAAQRVRLEACWARHEDEVRAAQRLRHRVFALEMGARLSPPRGTPPGLDVDRFDAHCEHLIVRTVPAADEASRVVGTYRVLTPDGARRAGGLYTDDEFDLTPMRERRSELLELGRSCTDPDYRHGTVMLLLWGSLAEFMQRNGLRWTIGCASVPMRDGGHLAASLWHGLAPAFLVEPSLRVRPRLPLPVGELRTDLKVEAPPLIQAYLNCGAQLLGAPAWDPDFGCADLPMLLDLRQLAPKHRRRFIGDRR